MGRMRYWIAAPVFWVLAACLLTGAASRAEYRYHGCPLYGPKDWFTTNLRTGGSPYVSNAIDSNSAKIIANLAAAYPKGDFAANVDPQAASVNLVHARNLRSAPIITGLAYGFANDPWNDDPPPYRMKIPAGRFMQEGTRGCGTIDCHVNVLDTDTCVVYETYTSGAPSWNGATYAAEGGGVKNLRHPYNDQLAGIPVTAASIPNMGTTDWGEESARTSIPHILAFFLGDAGLANGGYVAPAGYGNRCTSFCSHALPYGARLRLRASYLCPPAAAFPQAHLLCVQMKTYGIIFNDVTGLRNGFGVRLGLSSGGTNPWRSRDYNELLRKIRITDFDVMRLGPIHGD